MFRGKLVGSLVMSFKVGLGVGLVFVFLDIGEFDVTYVEFLLLLFGDIIGYYF